MKINPKMIRRPTVRKRGWRIENSKRRLKKREPEKGLKSCRSGQEVEDERNGNKKK
jgi:hypothetical protein